MPANLNKIDDELSSLIKKLVKLKALSVFSGHKIILIVEFKEFNSLYLIPGKMDHFFFEIIFILK
jgi:hypothetical protein